MGIAPNQQPMMLKSATERPMDVVDGVGGVECGKREAAREVTARTLLRVVSGN